MVKSSDFKQEFKKRCFHFSLSIINLEDSLINKKAVRIIFDQLLRSSMSIGANVVEGGSSSSKREFVNFFQIALKSASETLYWLALLRESDLQIAKRINPLIDECTEIKKMLTTIIMNTKSHSKF